MGELLLMSTKERQRKAVMENVKQHQISLVQAAKQLNVSYRQAKRIYKRYRNEGDLGLLHRRRGQSSGRALDPAFKADILRLYEQAYAGFGPTFAAQKLAEQGQVVHPETLRLWLVEQGLWQRQRKRKSYRKRRPRKEMFGELVQLDGSDHGWFGEHRSRCCLMHLVDDATGTSDALLATGETSLAALQLLQRWIERYGIPQAIYVDLKSVYVPPKVEQRQGATLYDTAFGQVCQRLGIEIVRAYSPQAKGRVERKHAVYQDRLVKEIKLQKLKTIEQVNDYLAQRFIDGINKKFAINPARLANGHRPTTGYDLYQTICFEYTRQLQNDFTFSFNATCYQVERPSRITLRPKSQITVREHLDHQLTAWYKENPLTIKPIEKPKKQLKLKQPLSTEQRRAYALKGKANSPWNQFNPRWLARP